MKILPLRNRVLIQKEVVEKSEGGIYIPEPAQAESQSGIVIEVGPDCKEISKGDRVFYPKYIGLNATVKGEKIFILREDEILANHRNKKEDIAIVDLSESMSMSLTTEEC